MGQHNGFTMGAFDDRGYDIALGDMGFAEFAVPTPVSYTHLLKPNCLMAETTWPTRAPNCPATELSLIHI